MEKQTKIQDPIVIEATAGELLSHTGVRTMGVALMNNKEVSYIHNGNSYKVSIEEALDYYSAENVLGRQIERRQKLLNELRRFRYKVESSDSEFIEDLKYLKVADKIRARK